MTLGKKVLGLLVPQFPFQSACRKLIQGGGEMQWAPRCLGTHTQGRGQDTLVCWQCPLLPVALISLIALLVCQAHLGTHNPLGKCDVPALSCHDFTVHCC